MNWFDICQAIEECGRRFARAEFNQDALESKRQYRALKKLNAKMSTTALMDIGITAFWQAVDLETDRLKTLKELGDEYKQADA